MNLHEYQAKQLFSRYGVPVPQGFLAESAEQARTIVERETRKTWVIKAQAHTGGRGKAGGVVITQSAEEAEAVAERLIGSQLVTHQTGSAGLPVTAVWLEEPSAIADEFYLGILLDRASRRLVLMASAAGGMDIEQVAAETPEKIITCRLDPAAGLQGFHTRLIGFGLGLDKAQLKQLHGILQALVKLYQEKDLSLVEINPLALTENGALLALDGKINIDDNALYRHPELVELRDPSQEDPREAQAHAHQLNYVSLDGNIGCMVNGAGLAMATMDLVQLQGGSPANFLDVGGGATAERVAEAFKLILSDDKVRAVLVNIFGGIVRCDLIAEGIIQAVKEVHIQVPVIVRLEGTNATEGLKLLADSGLALETAQDLTDAAEKVVAAAQAGQA